MAIPAATKIALSFDEGSTSPRIPRRQETSSLPSAKASRKFRSPFDDAKVTSVRDTRGRRGEVLLARVLARDMGGRARERARKNIKARRPDDC